MSIFNDIKEGILPDEKTLLYVYQNDIKDLENKEQIENYIKVLNYAYNNSTLEEKILLNRVIFILELLIDNQDSLENFILKAFSLNIHQVDESYLKFMDNFFNIVEEESLFKILDEIISEIINIPKEELRSFFNWNLHRLWNVPKFYSTTRFKLFYKNLQQLIIQLRDVNRIDDMMYVEFFTYHIMGNNFQTIDEWREFNQKVTQETIQGYSQFTFSLPKANPRKKNKKRIAFVKDRIVFNSPYQVEYSLFKSLMENKNFIDNYELIIYSFNQFEKTYDNQNLISSLKDLGIRVKTPLNYFKQDGYYNNHLDKALTLRQTLIDDEIDIMMAGGVFPILNFLYVTRTAPLQIYYSHGNCAYDVPNIDKRISHFEQVCKEFKWDIISIPLDKEFLVGEEGEKIVGEIIKNDYKNKFGADLVILGTIGRLIKINNDEYIESIAKIMEENPNTIYLACGTGNKENIKEKLKKYNIDENRFIFTGQIKSHVYGWVIDLWPDTFPLGAGQSRDEFIAKNKPVVFHSKRSEKFDEVEKGEFIVKDNENYIKITNNLIKNIEYRNKIAMIENEIWLVKRYKNKKNLLNILKDRK